MIIITFSGGLGNQMFQYALFKKFQSLGREVKADISFYDKYNSHNGFEMDKIFLLNVPRATKKNINELKDTSNFLRKYRRFFRVFWKSTDIEQIGSDFNDSIFSVKNAYLNGYWQSEKFFKDIESDIRKDFTFRNIDFKNKTILKKILGNNSISVHIRRGDYETHAQTKKLLGGICTPDYYNHAIRLICSKIKNPLFFIFSDDLTWTKKNLTLPDNAVFVDINLGENSYKDLFLMSNCKHNILANSSFSWWAAWLNTNPKKIIICPNKWSNSRRLDSKDRIPTNWIRLS